MNENTDDDEWLRSIQLVNVINRQPKVFAKWSALKDKFAILGVSDVRAEPVFKIEDVFTTINEAFDDH